MNNAVIGALAIGAAYWYLHGRRRRVRRNPQIPSTWNANQRRHYDDYARTYRNIAKNLRHELAELRAAGGSAQSIKQTEAEIRKYERKAAQYQAMMQQ